MPSISGNTSSTAYAAAFTEGAELVSFILVNKSGSSVTVNLYVRTSGSTDISIIPKDLAIAAGQAYISDTVILLNRNAALRLETTGSTDYYYSTK